MTLSATQKELGNARFQNALARRPQRVPPIWLMRQAGRYHKHYQALRARHSFVDLCKQPELAAEVALGPVLDFDFDAAILFSDLLFPLEALGLGLDYTDAGPKLGWKLDGDSIKKLRSVDDAWPQLQFQGEAVRATRERLPSDRSLIGFVGGPWTLFVYAVEGTHKGHLNDSKELVSLFPKFCESVVPLLARSIEMQLDSGAELVMIFDTAAGEFPSRLFTSEVVPQLRAMTAKHGSQVGYYSKGTEPAHLSDAFFQDGSLAGIGVDSRWNMTQVLDAFPGGFVQGNFDQSLLLRDRDELERDLRNYLDPFSDRERPGWICGLGHGVLPKTPEVNVRFFVDTVREVLQ
jgi:uroporphyrinogen decarboxylase